MRFYHLLLILCSSLFVACSTDTVTFPYENTLTPKLIPLQGVTFPVRFEVKQPFLVFQNMKRSDSLFHVYDLRNFELKSAFGEIGQGPGEFVSPYLLQTSFNDVFIEHIDEKVYRFSISEEGQPLFKEPIRIRHELGAWETNFINDSTYVVEGKHIFPGLLLLNVNSESPIKSWGYRDVDHLDYYSDPNYGAPYANDSRIVYCYENKKQLDFFDTDLNLIKTVQFKDVPPSDITKEDRKANYVKGYFGKRYFYALYFGMSWPEYRETYAGAVLEVFDLDGNPIARYAFDGICPVNFAVDEETFTLYGVGEEGTPEDYMLVYQLTGLS